MFIFKSLPIYCRIHTRQGNQTNINSIIPNTDSTYNLNFFLKQKQIKTRLCVDLALHPVNLHFIGAM